MASDILGNRRTQIMARGYLEALARDSRETVILVTLNQKSRTITYVEVVDGSQSVRFSVPVGSVRPIYSTAAGRVLLAFAPKEFRDGYLKAEKLRQLTPDTPTDLKALRKRLEELPAKGYDISLGDTVEDVGGLSAPIRDPDGNVAVALLLTGPLSRIKRDLQRLIPMVQDTAAKLSGEYTQTYRAIP
ncbi:hypothetical protein GCM10011534_42520 [Pseudooceanicola nanhaiensis]|jgi:DNA-binding IclR family transcriptional regulator|uniref:IclR-ED domain-containing protein n=1 Tax=Pseudooceanicola nanhaiensis TaxID=375761 RepID=A0A917TA28_9RHOB|nr:IclR family transcriptional regulator C-terminal domain-containing protein [Pseudooceanicola nanhaiensis]GGM16054.1 hypothetical protein GCM10011534_42520 [Pseudooceanicola nanhaiensis]